MHIFIPACKFNRRARIHVFSFRIEWSVTLEGVGCRITQEKITDFRVCKEYPQKSQIWKSETSPNQGTWLGIPWLGLVSLCQIWDFYGYSLNTLKYPISYLILSKNGNLFFFLCNITRPSPFALPHPRWQLLWNDPKSRWVLTSQISREIWVAMLVFHIFEDGGKSPERLCEQSRSPREETLLWKDFLHWYRSYFNSRKSVWSRLFATVRIHGFAFFSSAWGKLLQQGRSI